MTAPPDGPDIADKIPRSSDSLTSVHPLHPPIARHTPGGIR